ncbi:MAG: hypothetical protein ACRELC_06925, partial [Gemmatimonadota bacterium]
MSRGRPIGGRAGGPALPSCHLIFTPNPRAACGRAGAERVARSLPREDVERARREIGSWPHYAPSPLRSLARTAEAAGVARLWYKDEGKRFRQGSFKPMGGGYAVDRLLARRVEEKTGETVGT